MTALIGFFHLLETCGKPTLLFIQNVNRTFSKSMTFPSRILTSSSRNNRIFLSTVLPDFFPEKPPTVPSEFTTRWQGILGAYGFLRQALPTALYARVFNFLAIRPYVVTLPLGIFSMSFQTLLSKFKIQAHPVSG